MGNIPYLEGETPGILSQSDGVLYVVEPLGIDCDDQIKNSAQGIIYQ